MQLSKYRLHTTQRKMKSRKSNTLKLSANQSRKLRMKTWSSLRTVLTIQAPIKALVNLQLLRIMKDRLFAQVHCTKLLPMARTWAMRLLWTVWTASIFSRIRKSTWTNRETFWAVALLECQNVTSETETMTRKCVQNSFWAWKRANPRRTSSFKIVITETSTITTFLTQASSTWNVECQQCKNTLLTTHRTRIRIDYPANLPKGLR